MLNSLHVYTDDVVAEHEPVGCVLRNFRKLSLRSMKQRSPSFTFAGSEA
jgi:hypothetical protein